MLSLIPSDLPSSLRDRQTLALIGAGVAAAIGFGAYLMTRKRPTEEEMERERREMLARVGRITDGTIMDTIVGEINSPDSSDATPDSSDTAEETPPAPRIIVYNYRIAGVTYECAQDVTSLAGQVRGVRSDLPIQVRYAPHNPGNSIIVADSWSGLRLTSSHPHAPAERTDSAA